MWQWCNSQSPAAMVMEPLGKISSHPRNGWLEVARSERRS
jgi:hypothetical protein